jgi:hypothetical protein
MAYADLTQEQKHVLQEAVKLLRFWTRAQNGAYLQGQAIDLGYNNGVSAVLAELAANDVVPNEQRSDLPGSSELTKTDIINIMAHIQGIAATYCTAAHRGLWAKGCGPANMV